MVASVRLVHMNGRIYDPKLGRFLQADPLVDGVTNTQGYNRYSYVHNNLLSATDPTGHFSLRQAVGIIVAVVGTYICGPECGQLGYAIIGASAGAAGAAANGGNILKGAVIGGISGAAFSGVAGADFGTGFVAGATQFAAFGAVGGITNILAGGKFGHGFVAAGIGGSVAGPIRGVGGATTAGALARTVMRAVIGGTVSKITGHKFANGAAFAAFASILGETVDSSGQPEEGFSDKNGKIRTTTKGATSEQQKAIGAAESRVFNTARGKKMVEQLATERRSVEIRVNSNGDNSAPRGGNYMNVDPNNLGTIETSRGPISVTLERVIAHELGHAVFGDTDAGLLNVLRNENPIMRELGEPSRIIY